ncbi:hypothetical protein IP65_20030 [Novosphingobium sp. AAP1]|nr:hypothetical protein IP65_20030 [Novosphingobium sp. AAP1]
MFALGVVTRSRGEFHRAQLLDQIDQAPAHDAMDGRDWAALDYVDQYLALRIVERRTRSGGLAVQEAFRAAGVEPHHPVPNNLRSDTAEPTGRTSAPASVNFGQGQKTTRLVRVLRRSRQSAQECTVKILTQTNRCSHGAGLQCAGAIEAEFSGLGKPP